jgi:hypothetical protein
MTPKVFNSLDPQMTAEGTVGAPTCVYLFYFLVKALKAAQIRFVTVNSAATKWETMQSANVLFFVLFRVVSGGGTFRR